MKISRNALVFFCFGLFAVLAAGLPEAACAVDQKEEEQFFVAQKAFEDGFYDVAFNYADSFLEEYPQTELRAQAQLLIGKCYLYQGQYVKALTQLQGLVALPEAAEIKAEVFFWLGEVYAKGKDYQHAQESYRALIQQFPNSDYVLYATYSLGLSLSEQGKFKEALEVFQKFIASYPAHELSEAATLKAAECFYRLKDYAQTQHFCSLYLKNVAVGDLADAAYFYLAEAFYYEDNFEEAIKNYLKVIEVSASGKLKTLAKNGLGWSYLRLKRYEDALVSFREAKEKAQDAASGLDLILLGMATLASEKGNYEDALKFYQDIISTLPASSLIIDAFLGKAEMLSALGRDAEAVGVYEDLLAQKQVDTRQEMSEKARFGLAWVYLKLGKTENAVSQLKIVSDKTTDRTIKVSALSQIADAFQESGKLQEALDIYDQILKDYSESFYADYAQYQQGITLLKMERLDAATAAFQGLKAHFPNSKYAADAQYYLSLAYFKKEDFAAAKKYLESFMAMTSLKSDYRPEATLLLGMTFFIMRDYREAMNIYKAVIRDFKDNKDLVQKAEYEIAQCLYETGKASDAIKRFKIIVYKFPQTEVTFDALRWLGEYYFKTNQFELSRKYFQKIIDEFSQHEFVNEAHYEVGKTYAAEQRFDEALKEFELVRAVAKSDIAAYAAFEMAQIFARRGREQDVVKLIGDVIAAYPGLSKDAYARIGNFYRSVENYDKAAEFLGKALAAGQGDSQIRNAQLQFDLAQVYEERGQADKAVEAYLKVPYLYPADPFAVKAYLRSARIFENQENWGQAATIYEKVIASGAAESKFAQERLESIKENIKEP